MLQALVGLVVLLQFNRFAIVTGIASLVIVAVYPFMKRITYWPQVVLGLAFSWGALMGFAVVWAASMRPALVLYAGSIAWVIGYDTIYAHQDREDDALIGIKSTALLFGERTRAAGALLRAGRRADRRRLSWAGRRGRHGSGLRPLPRISPGRSSGSRSAIPALPAAVQIQPRRRAAVVRRIAGQRVAIAGT